MKTLMMMIEILATILEGYIGIKFAGLLLDSKYDEKKLSLYAATASSFLAIFVSFLNRVELFSYITVSFGIVSISIVALYLYKCKFHHAFFIISFYFMCMNYLDFFSISIVGALLHDANYSKTVVTTYGFMRIRQMLICKGLLVIAYWLAKHFIKEKFKNNSFKHYAILTMAGWIGVLYLIKSSMELVNFENVVNWAVFSVIIVLSWALVALYEKSKHEEDMARFMEMRNALLEENYRGLSAAYSANAKVYHDFNNHMNVLYQFLIRSDSRSALEYLGSISDPIKSLLERTWTGNEVIDVIINSKLKKMQENHIETSINVEFPNNSDILPSDICTILSNLLDNAIEACLRNQNSENKWVHITIRKINAMLIFKIENGNEEAPKTRNMRLVTSKADERFHGWGLKSVESAVGKYEGVMKHTIEANKFQVVVTLNYNIVEKC